MRVVKGYKVFNADWTCRGFQYAVIGIAVDATAVTAIAVTAISGKIRCLLREIQRRKMKKTTVIPFANVKYIELEE